VVQVQWNQSQARRSPSQAKKPRRRERKKKRRRRQSQQQMIGEEGSSIQVQVAFQILDFRRTFQVEAFRQEFRNPHLLFQEWLERLRCSSLFRHCRQPNKCQVTQIQVLLQHHFNRSRLTLTRTSLTGSKCHLPNHTSHSSRCHTSTRAHLSASLRPTSQQCQMDLVSQCSICRFLRISHPCLILPRCQWASHMVQPHPALPGTVSQTVKMIGGTTLPR